MSIAPPAGAADRLRAAGVAFADHGDLLRFSFHLYTVSEDVDRALTAIAG